MDDLTRIPGTILRRTLLMPVAAVAVTVALAAASAGCASGVEDTASPSTRSPATTGPAASSSTSVADGTSTSTAAGDTSSTATTAVADRGEDTDLTRPPASADGGFHAVVRVAANDLLNVREEPSPKADSPGGFTPFNLGVELTGEEADVGDQRWVQVDGGVGTDLDGWVNARFLVPIEGDTDQTFWFYRDASMARDVLSAPSQAQRLGDLIEATDPDGTVVVSADGYFEDEDQVLSVADLAGAGTASDSVRTWGSDPGTGEPITATIGEFFGGLGDDPSLTATEALAIDERIQFGSTIDNASEFFPDAVVVELHHPGDEADSFLSWRTTRMVLRKVAEADAAVPGTPGVTPEQDWQLVGLAFDSWTP